MNKCQIKISPVITIVTVFFMALAVLTGCAGSKKNEPRREDNVHGVRAHQVFMSGDFPRAIEVYKSGFAAARTVDNPVGAARSLSNIGRVYFEMNRPDSAALYFGKAHGEFTILGRKEEAARTAAWLALCFASAGDETAARRWFDTAASSADMNQPASDRHFYAVMKATLDFRLSSGIGDEAALNAAYTFYKKQKKHSALATIYILKADVEFSKNNCTAANQYLKNALASLDMSGERYRRSGTLIKLARANFCIGDSNLGKHFYERARDSAPKGITIPSIEEVEARVSGTVNHSR
ncbi:MAG: tetratricopeptide repeat protein [Chitinispirillales bacterium]|jgi:tetratricopeptide (TPR) repeat protein|nr:tetratricopeptide repeat protein [Chitinispirillales bacterium]